ncbi:hypothetical protein AVEN_270239-1 [Araneus ventricosus]|uniref:Uncharacterized protein n=1 Tax=Araneus ventricosus TaxID=182803 RepID=A0A4Y2JHK1_ARAVE|nr:hypothetical protein AVEN_270239-1 [Araneus ventricosus]
MQGSQRRRLDFRTSRDKCSLFYHPGDDADITDISYTMHPIGRNLWRASFELIPLPALQYACEHRPLAVAGRNEGQIILRKTCSTDEYIKLANDLLGYPV